MLELANISRSWGSFRLRNVSLTVRRGELFVLLGPNGAGKSLLLQTIAGFHRPAVGRIRIGGRDATLLPPEERNIGLVFQDPMLFPHRNVRQNIAFGLRARHVGRRATEKRVAQVARMLRLEKLLKRSVMHLSGGERKRVAIARALAIRPDVLLLDECFSSLDVPLKEALWQQLRELHALTGVTVVHVTHDRAEARALAQRMGIMRDGRIVQVGTEKGIFEQPANRFVAEFTGGCNVYTGEAARNGEVTIFRAGGMKLVTTAKCSGQCRAVVRPENIVLSPQAVRTSARNQIRGKVQAVERAGELFRVATDIGDHRMVCVITPQSKDALGVEPGREVYLSFKAGSVHLFQEETPDGRQI